MYPKHVRVLSFAGLVHFFTCLAWHIEPAKSPQNRWFRLSQRRSPVTPYREQAYGAPALDRSTPLSKASENFRDLPAHGRRAARDGLPRPLRAARGSGGPDQRMEGEPSRWRPGFRHQGVDHDGWLRLMSAPLRSYTGTMPVRKRPVKTSPTPPEQDVRKLQDAAHVERDFLRDLDRASTDRSTEKLAAASRRDPASPRT